MPTRGAERERGHLSGHQKAAVVFICLTPGTFELLLVVEDVGRRQCSAVIFRQLLLWFIQMCWSQAGTSSGGRPFLFWLATMFD